MRHGIMCCPAGDYADPTAVVELARIAEDAGWHGFFLNDHVVYDKLARPAVLDVWVGLVAIAVATSRLTVGSLVTPLCHRRPWLIANRLKSMMALAPGRLVLGAGLGSPVDDYGDFCEPSSATARKALTSLHLRQMLCFLTTLDPGSFDTTELVPLKQDPQSGSFRTTAGPLDVWLGGYWPGSALLDELPCATGVFLEGRSGELSAGEVAEISEYCMKAKRKLSIVVESTNATPQRISLLDRAGASWCLEYVGWRLGDLDVAIQRIARGPLGAIG